jgi:hypothetical protein
MDACLPIGFRIFFLSPYIFCLGAGIIALVPDAQNPYNARLFSECS